MPTKAQNEAAWDGQGEDPWLPARLQAMLDAQEAEDMVYQSIWASFNGWLVTTSRRVLRTPYPDPDAIFSMVPAWERQIGKLIVDALLPMMGWAYEKIFGEGFPWRQRVSVDQYLAGVRDRLVMTPPEVFERVAGQISAGVALGEGTQELAARVQEILSATATDHWANRAVVIARTEALGALNFSRNDAFTAYTEEGGQAMEKMWLATIDGRTRPTHRLADGQRVPTGDPFAVGGFSLMFPGDPTGPPQEVIQCRCTTILLEVGETIDLSDRQSRR